jgi:hypothetical protein
LQEGLIPEKLFLLVQGDGAGLIALAGNNRAFDGGVTNCPRRRPGRHSASSSGHGMRRQRTGRRLYGTAAAVVSIAVTITVMITVAVMIAVGIAIVAVVVAIVAAILLS